MRCCALIFYKIQLEKINLRSLVDDRKSLSNHALYSITSKQIDQHWTETMKTFNFFFFNMDACWMIIIKFFSVEFVTDVFYNAKAKDLCVHYLLGNIEHLMWYRVLYHRQMQNLFKWQQFPKISSITTQHHEQPKKQL